VTSVAECGFSRVSRFGSRISYFVVRISGPLWLGYWAGGPRRHREHGEAVSIRVHPCLAKPHGQDTRVGQGPALHCEFFVALWLRVRSLRLRERNCMGSQVAHPTFLCGVLCVLGDSNPHGLKPILPAATTFLTVGGCIGSGDGVRWTAGGADVVFC